MIAIIILVSLREVACILDKLSILSQSDDRQPAQRPIKGTLANSVDPDQALQNAASDQDLHGLLKIQEFL